MSRLKTVGPEKRPTRAKASIERQFLHCTESPELDSQSKEFGRTVQRGTQLVLIAQAVSQVISLLVIAALYRLVERESFGLIGMLVPLLMLLRMVSTQGLGVATIQEQKLDDYQLTSLFWLNLSLGAAASVLTCAGSFGLAKLYDAPQLISIGVVLAGTSLVAAGGSQHLALLERKLQFGVVIRVRLIGQLAGGLAAVTSAFWLTQNGYWGVWALIIQQYVELTVNLIGGWWAEPWRPGRPTRMRTIGELVRFGGYYSGANVVFFLSRNIDKVILSLLFGSTPLGREMIGMYSQAFNQMMKPVQLVTSPLSGILLPALSRARDQPAVFSELVSRFYRLATLVLAPSAVGLFVVAVDGFRILGGDEWIDAGKMLETLALAILAQGLINLCGSLLGSRGKARALFIGSISVFCSLLIGMVLVTTLRQGDESDAMTLALTVGWCFTLVTILICPLYVAVCLRACDVSRRAVLKELLYPIAIAIWMGGVAWMCREILERTAVPAQLRLVIVIASGAIFYVWLTRDALKTSALELFGRSKLEPDEPTSPPPQSDEGDV